MILERNIWGCVVAGLGTRIQLFECFTVDSRLTGIDNFDDPILLYGVPSARKWSRSS